MYRGSMPHHLKSILIVSLVSMGRVALKLQSISILLSCDSVPTSYDMCNHKHRNVMLRSAPVIGRQISYTLDSIQ